MNEDDAEKGLVFWDVFKTAKLESLKAKQIQDVSPSLRSAATYPLRGCA